MSVRAAPGIPGTDRSIVPDALRDRASAARAATGTRLADTRGTADFHARQAQFMQRQLVNDVAGKLPADLETTEETTRVRAAINGTFMAVVSGAVTLLIGIYVFSQISSTMPNPSNSALNKSTNTVLSTTGSAFQLGAVAIIVLVAVLILSLVSGGFGGGNEGGRR